MKRKVLIEGLILFSASLLALVGGVSGLIRQEASDTYDLIGPYWYLIGVGASLMIVGLLHVITSVNRNLLTKKIPIQETSMSVWLILTMLIYAFLIGTVGYFVASLAFFLVVLRILEIKPLAKNILLAIGFSGSFYLIFVFLMNIIFPRGLLF